MSDAVHLVVFSVPQVAGEFFRIFLALQEDQAMMDVALLRLLY
ncbi:hypothetical protein [Nitrosovibrio tenuis]|uniref:Uncharacterized protein n=1 Tax=Nitrosovibrio tenuis TaxID=1233 RepID=A0A1H7J125_9PROT|nr:hypothetical protein [Nitrosovibrio tenuis]SEK67902.1 hypothetical protein SAMN05216387_102348 [Nitrosovibrio tenuis]